VLRSIAKIQAIYGRSANPFPIVCGTSAGALNAAAIACGADQFGAATRALKQVWTELHVEQVYRASVADMIEGGFRWLSLMSIGWLIARGKFAPKSILDNTPLGDLLRMHIPLRRLPDLLQTHALDALAITASSYSSGEHVTFYEGKQSIAAWKRNQRIAIPTTIHYDHLLASAAIPLIFAPVALPLNGPRAYFGDGSVRQTSPLSPAIHMGAEQLFVIGSAKPPEPSTADAQDAPAPSLSDVIGHSLSSIFIDALPADLERLERINQTLSRVPAGSAEVNGLRPIRVMTIFPSQRIDHLAQAHLQALPQSVQRLMRLLGDRSQRQTRSARGGALLSYLLFESDFTRSLVALGEQDAWNQRQQIADFLGFSEPNKNAHDQRG
jgi:NTE family protein